MSLDSHSDDCSLPAKTKTMEGLLHEETSKIVCESEHAFFFLNSKDRMGDF